MVAKNKNGAGQKAGANKNNNNKNKKKQPSASRSGYGKMPSVPRAANTATNPIGGTVVASKAGFDAFSKAHLTLPRPVANYTVMRTIKRLPVANQQLYVLSPFTYQDTVDHAGDHGDWCNIIGLSANVLTKTVNQADAWNRIGAPTVNSDWLEKSITPSAYSVRVYNPKSVQTTEGTVTMGRVSSELNWSGSSDTIDEKLGNLRNAQNLVMMSAAELALKPQQIDAMPLDLNQLSDFTSFYNTLAHGEPFTWTGASRARPAGFTPIFIYNPSSIDLVIEICMEMRVRVEPENPFSSTMVHYPPTKSETWDRIMRTGLDANAHGVRMISGH